MKNIFLVFFITLFFLTACGYKEGVVQKAEVSYLKFVGNTQGASVQVDDIEAFRLSEGSTNNGTIHQISPGKHLVKVYRNGELVVNRVLILDNQITKEVMIP